MCLCMCERERELLRDYVTNEPLRRRVVPSNQGIEKVNESLQGKEIRSGNEARFVENRGIEKKKKKKTRKASTTRNLYTRANRLHLEYLTV